MLRVILQDDEVQTAIAERVFDQPTLLLATVVIEVFWVLKNTRGWLPDRITAGLNTVLRLRTLRCPDERAIRWALGQSCAGADFPDMLHLALSHQASSFVTFDQRIARFADASVVPVETLAA